MPETEIVENFSIPCIRTIKFHIGDTEHTGKMKLWKFFGLNNFRNEVFDFGKIVHK